MKLFSTLFLFIIVFSSCKKQTVNIKNADQNITLKSPEGSNVSINSGSLNAFNSWLQESSFIKSKINSGKTSSLEVPDRLMFEGSWHDKIIGAVHIKQDSMWIGDFAGRTFIGYADEFTMLPEWLGQKDNFYLGNLIKGNTISTLDMTPLSERLGQYESRPISASISLPGKTVSGTFNPNELSASQFYSKLLQDNGMANAQKAAYSYSLQEFTYYDELRTVFGSNVKVSALFYGSGSTSTNGVMKIAGKSGLVAKFVQKNFSLDMDVPEPGELYANLDLNAVVEGYWPAYISNITYGSTGILVIESEENQQQVNSTFKKAFSVLGGLVSGTSELNSAEIATINNSMMKIYFIGPNGAEAVKRIVSVDELLGFIKKGSDFSAQTPGVPISFKMKSLKDNKTINNNFRIDAPVDKIYAKINIVQEGSLYASYLDFYGDEGARIPIVAPARITFNMNNYRMVREGSPREGFNFVREGDAKQLNNTSHLTRMSILRSSSSSFPMRLTDPADGSYIVIKP
ncbi:thiol-activated cytolysin family protein [Pedobacter sp. NJ-S-72]